MSESDQIVIFLKKPGIKLAGFAKGARKSHKRFVNTLQPLNYITLKYKTTPSGSWLQESKLIRPYIVGRENYELLGTKHVIREALLKLLPENDRYEGLFDLVISCLTVLDKKKKLEPAGILCIFLVRYMSLLGYMPPFDKCSICGKELEKTERWVWQLVPIRTTCAIHRLSGSLKWEWDLEILKILQNIPQWPVDKLWNIKITRSKQRTLLHNLSTWFEVTAHKKLRSLLWLQRTMENVNSQNSGS
ncbi:MAG: DNA repair protein RecO [Deltaproteobacteria bacterium]|nr:DNA repair protein RecO [Deltaproteobacteria bacterium]MBW2069466.1 DNA repair protein RecO [Deltaproteobacteria bacterium]